MESSNKTSGAAKRKKKKEKEEKEARSQGKSIANKQLFQKSLE